jgi:hypothetical protein
MKTMLFLLMTFALVLTACDAVPDRRARTPHGATEAFYQDWINHDGNPMVDRIYAAHPLVTPRLIDRVDAIIASFDRGGYDPVLCAQDFPAAFRVEAVSADDTTAAVRVVQQFGEQTRAVDVSLRATNGIWQIDAIRCPGAA